jgi:hypothetical protein
MPCAALKETMVTSLFPPFMSIRGGKVDHDQVPWRWNLWCHHHQNWVGSHQASFFFSVFWRDRIAHAVHEHELASIVVMCQGPEKNGNKPVKTQV